MVDLKFISNALVAISDDQVFNNWVSENLKELDDFFYKKSGTEFNEIGFEFFYFDIFLKSVVYKNYHLTKNGTEGFFYFLTLISVASEKLAVIGLNSSLITIIGDLPFSANKHRLIAFNEFTLLDDIKTEYFDRFHRILDNLDKSRTEFEDGDVRQILDVVIAFFTTAKKSFERSNLNGHLDLLKAKFREPLILSRYPFLENPIILDLLDGCSPFGLLLNDFTRECLLPSPTITRLFNDINSEYFRHSRIDHFNDDLWGFSKKYILDNILVRGRGDYTIGTGEITADDKVLLYCFYNLKKHFFTSYAVFETVVNSLQQFFKSSDYVPTFVDLGCGPMTSGLAISDLMYSMKEMPIDIHYIGIDISQAMINKSKKFQSLPLFSENCTFNYYLHWEKIEFPKIYSRGKNNPIIFNASYLFASSSVDAEDLAKTVLIFAKNFTNVYFVFQNPNRIDRNINYNKFKSYLNFDIVIKREEIIQYKAASNVSQEEVYYEILKILPL